MTELITKISPNNLYDKMKKDDLVLVDIRSAQEYRGEYLEGSINIPIEEFEMHEFEANSDKVAVFYCRGGHRTSQATSLLRGAPFKEVMILDGGIMAWKARKLSTIKSIKAPIDLMRQVQIIAGGLIVTGAGLGFFINPNYILISGFVGAGLFFAGVSGFCGMAQILGFMPWNKSKN